MSRVPLALHQAVEAALSREIRMTWKDMHTARKIATTTLSYELGVALTTMARQEKVTLLRLLRIRRAARQAAKVVAVVGLLLAAAIAAPTAHAAEPWNSDDVRDAISRTSPTVACIVTAEIGPALDPYSVGAAGEIGPAQLLPVRGLLPDFQYGSWVDLAPEFRDPNSPYMAVAYLESALDRGLGSNWSTFPGCVS